MSTLCVRAFPTWCPVPPSCCRTSDRPSSTLYVKVYPCISFIVTSVLRTQEDVSRLRRHNGNATENSCHLYGTTFDICYNRYETVEDPEGPPRRRVRDDTLKFVLSEVLRDMREQGRCFIKYEVKQGCFHMTVR